MCVHVHGSPYEGGKQENPVPSPKHRGGLGWGNLRNNGDSITCVYTVAYGGEKQENPVPSPLQGYRVHTS